MIVFGTNTSKILVEQLEKTSCTNCGEHKIAVVIRSHYAHIFWVPFFPFDKSVSIECINCKQVSVYKDIPPTYKEQVDILKSKVSDPIWHYLGFFLIAVLFVFVMIMGKMEINEKTSILEAPLVGDRYQIKYDVNEYSVWKVLSVSADSVFVAPHVYVTDKISGLDQTTFADDEAFNRASTFSITRDSLIVMLNKGKLKDVIR